MTILTNLVDVQKKTVKYFALYSFRGNKQQLRVGKWMNIKIRQPEILLAGATTKNLTKPVQQREIS